MSHYDDITVSERAERINDWIRLVRAEYLEIPGLHLTKSQVQKLWGLDSETCNHVLDTLQASRFLARTSRDGYILARH